MHGPQTGVPIALVSAHVAAPHRYRKYFPHKWLSHVRDNDCRSVLEARSADGKSVTRCVAEQSLANGFRHASLDIAAFVLDAVSVEGMEDFMVTLDERPLSTREEVRVVGFRLLGESGSGTEAVVATEVRGQVSEVAETRGFINTGDIETEMGMCGGPVLRGDDSVKCVGILEGLVPRVSPSKAESELHKRVSGHSVYIGARELGMFVYDVETEHTRALSSA